MRWKLWMWKLLDHLDLLTRIYIFHQIEYKQMEEDFTMVWKSDFTWEEEQEVNTKWSRVRKLIDSAIGLMKNSYTILQGSLSIIIMMSLNVTLLLRLWLCKVSVKRFKVHKQWCSPRTRVSVVQAQNKIIFMTFKPIK